MTSLKRMLLICSLLLTSVQVSSAQTKDKTAFPTNYTACDSLGDHYLFIEDTAMAIHCYQKAVDLDSSKTDKRKSLEKLRRCYTQSAQSFYLKVN